MLKVLPLFKNICEQSLKLLAFELVSTKDYKPGDLIRAQSKRSLLNEDFKDEMIYNQLILAKKIANLKKQAEAEG